MLARIDPYSRGGAGLAGHSIIHGLSFDCDEADFPMQADDGARFSFWSFRLSDLSICR